MRDPEIYNKTFEHTYKLINADLTIRFFSQDATFCLKTL